MLKQISTILMQICHFLSDILKVDLIIVDDHLQWVVKTFQEGTVESQSQVTVSSIISNVVKSGKPVVLNHTQENPGCSVCADRLTCKVGGFIGVPILLGDQILGGIAMISPIVHSINTFGNLHHAVETLETLANIISIMVEEHTEEKEPEIPAAVWTNFPGTGAARIGSDGTILTRYGELDSLFPSNAATVSTLLPLAPPLKCGDTQSFFYSALEPDGFFGKIQWMPGGFLHDGSCSSSFLLALSMKHVPTVSDMQWAEECKTIPFRHIAPYEELFDSADALTCNQLPALIVGENGTGKAIFAAYIHTHSSRANHSFVCIDCQTLPPKAQTAAVFGGDDENWENGCILKALLGTIYFTNIEYMSLDLQEQLYAFMAHKLPSNVGRFYGIPDIRFLFDTSIPLDELGSGGYLLPAFCHILKENVLTLPTLKPGDSHFFPVFESILNQCAQYNHCGNFLLSPELKQAVLNRQRTNLEDLYRVSEIIVRSVQMHTISLSEVPMLNNIAPKTAKNTEAEELEEIHRLLNQRVKKTEIAKRLNISRATLYRRMKQLGIDN